MNPSAGQQAKSGTSPAPPSGKRKGSGQRMRCPLFFYPVPKNLPTNDLFANHSWYFRNALVRANYQNVQKGISRNSEYLERFFRNLLLGETNELRNRYMVVNAPEELVAEQIKHINRTSTEQPTVQVTEQVRALLFALSNEQLSLKMLMEKVGLKHRPTFLENYINPALRAGILKVLYPDKPNHPRQKYLLTAKGLALYNEIRVNVK